MTFVIDNGNPNPPSTPGGWTPVHAGDIFCSPLCGAGCKKADFDNATAQASLLVSQLGHGWQSRVWENLGWHFEATKRDAIVSVDEDGNYEASISFNLDDRHSLNVSETRRTPREAVTAVVTSLQAKIKVLQRALVSISPEPFELASNAGVDLTN
ncbi:hypothetical protein [Comamonas thiooxydans]|uniref:hypothetical protein n=1 Tax=Comamonas thiooxydans TaxID=363952 RepID=UPI00103BFB06|nr:hypothetical protein [Comamonas thiooxydans]